MDQISRVIRNDEMTAGYRRLVFLAPHIAETARPGQFVHVQIPGLRDRILRRPFSISSADPAAGTVTVIFKVVGLGTTELAKVKAGVEFPVLGPLGNGYRPVPGSTPVLIAGGYGSASTLFLAERSEKTGLVLMGARTEHDLILRDEYQALGFRLLAATNDGSFGRRGFVTDLLEEALSSVPDPAVYACGPRPMLFALGRLLEGRGIPAQLSLDQHMCCGVGACFACVVKLKDADSPDGFRYSRSCKEGPVYPAEEVYCRE